MVAYGQEARYCRFYCDRCDRGFDSYEAEQQHQNNSPRHHVCPMCDYDAFSWPDLENHFREDGCMVLCEGCRDGQGTWWNPDCPAWINHSEDYNVCDDCDRHFDTVNNLHQHQQVHYPRTIECYRCTDTFKNYSHMILHLEGGYCSSGFKGRDLERLAARCYQSKHYMDSPFRELIQTSMTYNEIGQAVSVVRDHLLPYFCPTCKHGFSKPSGLFQHVDSRACGQRLHEGAIGKLVHFLDISV